MSTDGENRTGLWTPPSGIMVGRSVKRVVTVTLPSGKRAKITTEGTEKDGYVQHIETDDGIDANAMPNPIRTRTRMY
jgi:hypothetical protein